MRRLKVVASMALIALLATVAVPGPVGSSAPNATDQVAPDLFQRVEGAAAVRGSEMTIQPLDPDARSAGALDQRSTMFEPATRAEPPQARVPVAQPKAPVEAIVKHPWRTDRNISWYGPGFYGNRTACGLALTTLTFKNPANGRTVTLPVVDRGPYVSGRSWDLTGGACTKLGACRTGTLLWRFPSGS